MSQNAMLQKMSDTIRFLAADMVQEANSGHPGMPMGMADILTVFSQYFKHNPKNAKWLNRDRVVFSGGHGSALVYSMLHLWGYDLTLEDLKAFRQMGSKTPGHPEADHTDGIEVTTGPLGQGVANAVGFAMASKYASHLLNSETAKIIDHKVWCFCGDGDLEEGISYEACSLAGHNQLENLVVIYDSNDITIEGDTGLALSEDMQMRFTSQGWDVKQVDGHDFDAIDGVFQSLANQTKPTLVIARTKIGKGAANMEGSHKTHGAPLGDDELAASKTKAGFDPDARFAIGDDVLARFRCAIEKGDLSEREWKKLLNEAPLMEQNAMLERLENPDFSAIDFPQFELGEKKATRQTNGAILNAMAKALPGFIGGSADLAPSNNTELKDRADFPKGPNFHFGIREHAMGAITNGMARYGLFLPFCATFFIFSDYLKPSARVAALMNAKLFYIFTHDSIGVGEDGATHQPIEQLSTFRAVPNFYSFRPADGNENVESWKTALNLNAPVAFVLTRQGLPTLDRSSITGSVAQGGYLLSKSEDADTTLIASGSEVSLALEAKAKLEAKGRKVNVVSVPCYDLLVEQDQGYIDSIILPSTRKVAIEAASANEWYRFADEVIGMSGFGASAPGGALFKHFGFDADAISERLA